VTQSAEQSLPQFTKSPWHVWRDNGRIFIKTSAVMRTEEADANLLAAAPDLYAALKRFLSTDPDIDAAAEVEMAEAALRKAEGRAQS